MIMDQEHQEYVKYIQQLVESACPYTDENLRRLYHAGFVASYLASQMQKDPFVLRDFKRHVDKVADSKKFSSRR